MDVVWLALGAALLLVVGLVCTGWWLIADTRRRRPTRTTARTRFTGSLNRPAHLLCGQRHAVTVAELLERVARQSEGIRLTWPDADIDDAELVRPYAQDLFRPSSCPGWRDKGRAVPRTDKPRELEELLDWARARGFYLHVSDPGRIMVLARAVPRTIDIAHIRGPASVAAARLVNDSRANIWRPPAIVTHYYGDCTHALEYLKSLTDTDTPTLNSRPYTPPGRSTDGINPLHVTDTERATMKIHRPTINHPMEAPGR